jgi:SAM-dependent methyltransferase
MAAFDPQAYWEARLAADDSLHGVGYRGLGRRYNEWMYRVRAAAFDRALRALPENLATARVLDIGSGTGFYVGRWLRHGVHDLIASDLTEVSCDRLRARFPDIQVMRLDVGDGSQAFEPGSVDVISAFDVLFHIVDDDRYATALRSIAAWLRPGGAFIWSDNFVRAEDSAHARARRGPHQVSRSRAVIEGWLADAGLRIIERRPMFSLMNAPVDSGSAWRWRIWSAVTRLVRGSERRGWLVGAVLYPLELALTAFGSEGPSTEVVVCRREP